NPLTISQILPHLTIKCTCFSYGYSLSRESRAYDWIEANPTLMGQVIYLNLTEVPNIDILHKLCDLCTSLKELKFDLNYYDDDWKNQLKRDCRVSLYTIRQLAKQKQLTQLELYDICVNLESLSLALESEPSELVQMNSLKSLRLIG